MNIFIISDTHFGHRKLIEFGRPEDFEEKILKSLRNKFSPGDVLIHLGDICIGKDEEMVNKFTKALPLDVRLILVRGNHDHKSMAWYLNHGFDMVVDEMSFKYMGKKLLFTHAPQIPEPQKYDRNIHGHTHGNTHRDMESGAFYDKTFYHTEVALELNGYRMVSLKELLGL